MTNNDLHNLIRLCTISGNNLSDTHFSADIVPFVVSNGMGPWLFNRLKNSHLEAVLSAPDLSLLRQSYVQTTMANRHKLTVYREVKSLLQANGIEIAALKGMALAFTVYPDEGLRPMGDIDLLVDASHVFKARDLLIAHGGITHYVPRSALHEQVSAHVRPVVYKGVMIELHQRFYALGNPLNVALKQLPVNRLAESKVTSLEDVWFAYHLATHTYYGFQMKGMRLGWLVDLALLCRRQPDWKGFQQQVAALNPAVSQCVDAVFQWIKPFLCDDADAFNHFPDLSLFRQPDQIKQAHRWLNLQDMVRTPGLSNKLMLVMREFIPEKEYMRFRYGSDNWLAYRKRLFRF
jgi:hypothetical protein